jgi:hypothetical protein
VLGKCQICWARLAQSALSAPGCALGKRIRTSQVADECLRRGTRCRGSSKSAGYALPKKGVDHARAGLLPALPRAGGQKRFGAADRLEAKLIGVVEQVFELLQVLTRLEHASADLLVHFVPR